MSLAPRFSNLINEQDFFPQRFRKSYFHCECVTTWIARFHVGKNHITIAHSLEVPFCICSRISKIMHARVEHLKSSEVAMSMFLPSRMESAS